ncbi:MAG TPA: lysophospholipid acyltransferase family protein [Sumerlaeia bacterium]|nr:lysophospholipid acyltransferase family protein [Sumerlaeia bacterium]
MLLTCLYLVCFTVPFLVSFVAAGRGDFEDAMRIHNCLFGRYVLFFARPLVRVRCSGLGKVPREGPVVLVFNHRCYADVFFTSLQPRANTNIAVRAWPFRLPVLGRFMRGAGYIDFETTSMDEILEKTRDQAKRGVSFLFFPEGHRSRDGQLQPFRSGAFRLAAEHGLPVVPICLAGTEKMVPFGAFMIRPARVDLDVLTPLYPADFPEERRALRMRRETERMFRRYLGEMNGSESKGEDDDDAASAASPGGEGADGSHED